jgi:hypothetical protein
MENMKMPLRKLYAEYTKSELGLMAWRSGEISVNMHSNYRDGVENSALRALATPKQGPVADNDPQFIALEERLGPTLVSKLDEEMDMRKLTGDEVRLFLGAQGIHLPIGLSRQTFGGEDEVSQRVAAAYKDHGKKT